ncbi:hypothetical protein PtA15_3A701 [Puccinia triticina]|uniref:Uncharacterized protein n=1 Tax=Puccinia triticina TaxID=208348 RepID=A0ABY7CFR6_9BASI|nr:uncharacterized protein PtA15_3A701 [Puccinia triticina]WAQ83332.1 hypothetical protein PtA15_3A701 [Puccinia triticina]
MGGHKRPALPPSRANSDGRPNRRSDISPRPNPNELPPRAATALGRSPGIARCDRFAEGSYSLNSVVLAAPVPSDKDHDLDILKNHRTEALAQNVYSLIQHGLKPLFNHHADFLLGFEDSKEHQSATPNHSTILQSTTEAFEMIDNLMRWFQKSDFCFIQEHWQASIDCAKAHMLSVIPSLNSLVRDAQESDPANNNESDPQPSATSALQQNQPFQNNSPTTFEPNPPPEASPAQEHQSEVRSAKSSRQD